MKKNVRFCMLCNSVFQFTCGAKIPPIRAHVDEDPTAVLRISVGNISAVYTKMMQKEQVAPNLPTIDKVVWKSNFTVQKQMSVCQLSFATHVLEYFSFLPKIRT